MAIILNIIRARHFSACAECGNPVRPGDKCAHICRLETLCMSCADRMIIEKDMREYEGGRAFVAVTT